MPSPNCYNWRTREAGHTNRWPAPRQSPVGQAIGFCRLPGIRKMSFLNLGLGELLGLIGAISAGVVALYLLDRSKRKQVVATLRFWTDSDIRTQLQHRRKIQQPWSLLLELLSLILLLAGDCRAAARFDRRLRTRPRVDSGHLRLDGIAGAPARHPCWTRPESPRERI